MKELDRSRYLAYISVSVVISDLAISATADTGIRIKGETYDACSRVTGIDDKLADYDNTVGRNFRKWVFEKQAGALKFNGEQMNWRRMMKEHIATSFHIEVEDPDYTPFYAIGGRGKMFQLFGVGMNVIIGEMNAALAAAV